MEERLLDRRDDHYKLGQAQLILAQLHNVNSIQEASKVKKLQNFNQQNAERCQCCNLPLVNFIQHAPQFSLFCSNEQLAELGIGIPLTFYFIKNTGLMLLILFICLGVPTFLGKILTEEGIDLTKIEFGTQQDQINEYQGIMHSVAAILMVVNIIIMKRYNGNRIKQLDLKLITPSDFSIMVQNVDQAKFYLRFGGITQFQINQAYDISDYMQQIRYHRYLYNQYQYVRWYTQKYQKHPKKGWICKKKYSSLQKIEEDIKQTEDLLRHIEKQNQLQFRKVGVSFITFRRQTDAAFVLTQFEQSWWNLSNFQKKKVKKAPEPSDLIWAHLGVSYSKKFKRRLCTYLISGCLLIISFIIIFLLKQVQISDYSETQEQFIDSLFTRSISFLISYTIVFINNCLSITIRVFSFKQLYSTWTDYHKIVFIKRVILLTINSLGILLLVNIQSFSKQGIFQSESLLSDVQSLLLVDAFFSPLIKLIGLFYTYKLLKRKKMIKKQIDGKLPCTQAFANQLWENPQPDISQWYSDSFKTLLIGVFFSPLFPLAPLIASVSVFTHYWADKYLLLRRLARPREFRASVAKVALRALSLVILLYSISNLVIQYVLGRDYIFVPITVTCLIVLYFFVPLRKCYEKKITYQDKANFYVSLEDDFEEQNRNFDTDYKRSNPATSKKAWQQWEVKYGCTVPDSQFEKFSSAFPSYQGYSYARYSANYHYF